MLVLDLILILVSLFFLNFNEFHSLLWDFVSFCDVGLPAKWLVGGPLSCDETRDKILIERFFKGLTIVRFWKLTNGHGLAMAKPWRPGSPGSGQGQAHGQAHGQAMVGHGQALVGPWPGHFMPDHVSSV